MILDSTTGQLSRFQLTKVCLTLVLQEFLEHLALKADANTVVCKLSDLVSFKFILFSALSITMNPFYTFLGRISAAFASLISTVILYVSISSCCRHWITVVIFKGLPDSN